MNAVRCKQLRKRAWLTYFKVVLTAGLCSAAPLLFAQGTEKGGVASSLTPVVPISTKASTGDATEVPRESRKGAEYYVGSGGSVWIPDNRNLRHPAAQRETANSGDTRESSTLGSSTSQATQSTTASNARPQYPEHRQPRRYRLVPLYPIGPPPPPFYYPSRPAPYGGMLGAPVAVDRRGAFSQQPGPQANPWATMEPITSEEDYP